MEDDDHDVDRIHCAKVILKPVVGTLEACGKRMSFPSVQEPALFVDEICWHVDPELSAGEEVIDMAGVTDPRNNCVLLSAAESEDCCRGCQLLSFTLEDPLHRLTDSECPCIEIDEWHQCRRMLQETRVPSAEENKCSINATYVQFPSIASTYPWHSQRQQTWVESFRLPSFDRFCRNFFF